MSALKCVYEYATKKNSYSITTFEEKKEKKNSEGYATLIDRARTYIVQRLANQ